MRYDTYDISFYTYRNDGLYLIFLGLGFTDLMNLKRTAPTQNWVVFTPNWPLLHHERWGWNL